VPVVFLPSHISPPPQLSYVRVSSEAIQNASDLMMDTLHARADWETVGNKWFRKTQQYTELFDQDLDLDNYIVAGAPYAGALGMLLILWPRKSSQTTTLLVSSCEMRNETHPGDVPCPADCSLTRTKLYGVTPPRYRYTNPASRSSLPLKSTPWQVNISAPFSGKRDRSRAWGGQTTSLCWL
jgi:hypothetical protein